MWQEHQQGSQRQRDWNEVDGDVMPSTILIHPAVCLQ